MRLIGLVLCVLLAGCPEPKGPIDGPSRPRVDSLALEDTSDSGPVVPVYSGSSIPKDALAALLPDNLGLGSSRGVSTGSKEVNGCMVNRASRDYILTDGGSVTIAITDFACNAHLEAKQYNPQPQEAGVQIESFKVTNGFGFSRFILETRSGEYHVLLGNRVGVDIDAYNLPESFGGLPAIAERVRFQQILELVEKTPSTGK